MVFPHKEHCPHINELGERQQKGGDNERAVIRENSATPEQNNKNSQTSGDDGFNDVFHSTNYSTKDPPFF